jgi:Secretion system C-terminal sorting domain
LISVWFVYTKELRKCKLIKAILAENIIYMKHNYQKCIKLLTLLVCVVFSQYSGYSRTAGNIESLNTVFDTPCAGTSSVASQGTFSTGYTYNFTTVGNSVTITFTMLDTDKVGVVAYLWQQTPFAESDMPASPPGSLTFSKTITGQTVGNTITYAVKFAYAGGMVVTQFLSYVVGDTCGGTLPTDTVTPTGFTAAVGTVTSTSVQLLLNGSDDSNSVIYTVTYNGNTVTSTGVSGTQQPLVINNLTADTDYTFTVTAADAAGNVAANNPIVLQASTPEGIPNTACAGTSSEAAEGTFSTGYTYSFQTVGNSVTATFQLLDTDKVGVVAYLWQQTPFVEMMMDPNGGLSFSKTVTGLTPGTVVNYGVKFAYSGGLSRTVYYSYTVGDNCSGTTDTEAPGGFTATVGTVAPTSVQLLLNGTDDSGSVIYTITFNGTTVTTSGVSGTAQAYVISGLTPNTAYTFTVTATDLAGNAAANNPITLTATTLQATNSVPCTGNGTAAQQGTFSTGYSYSIQTINGNDVVVAFTMLDTDKTGVVAYLWQQTPFAESAMINTQGTLIFTGTLTNQTPGATIGLAVKFAYAGGLVVTEYITYVVGQDCEAEEDTVAPANFIATVGDITSDTVELLLNATDNSGTVTYTITYGTETITVTGVSGIEESVIIDGLTAETAYSFSVEASDATGNEAANNAIVVDATTLVEDTEAPTGFTATVGAVGITTVELILNGTDTSGEVIYTITYNGSEIITVTGVSGEQASVVISGLGAEGSYTFSVTATDASGNAAANNPIVLQATTLEDTNTECGGVSTEAQDGTFSTGYNYSFETTGNDVTVTFEMLDTDKEGVVAYLWQQTPFTETLMTNTEELTFSTTVTGQTPGTDINFAVKFAYSGGLSVTKYFTYTVGENCGLGVNEPELNASVKLYPNPASNMIHIDSQVSEVSKIEIYSVLGRKMLETTDSLINVAHLSDGMYLVKIYAGNKVLTKKLIVE